jgi:phosphatidate cytidylyltransferase
MRRATADLVASSPPVQTPALDGMLIPRILTAVVLLALLIPSLAAQLAWPFLVLTLVLITAAAWEWARLNGSGPLASCIWGLGLAIACGLAWQAGWTAAKAPDAVWWLAAVVWVAGGAVALRFGPDGWPVLPRSLRLALGWLALCCAWLALASARAIGLSFILSILCLVWAADIAAYFGGRALGKRKLAPSISPGKSWEGVISGLVGVAVLVVFWTVWERNNPGRGPSLFTTLFAQVGWVIGSLMLVVLTGMSVVGDLVESLVKRAAGAKDSSRLLPGHGGVLDRVDALLPTLPMAIAFSRWGA